MRVVLFGATGMVGGSVLRECLDNPCVETVLAVGRRSSGHTHPKLRGRVLDDLFDGVIDAEELAACDACFFCLGTSSIGKSERDYARITHELTLRWARLLGRVNPSIRFLYVSGIGADGRSMWARVRRRTERALLALLPGAAVIRLGAVRPVRGERPATRGGRLLLVLFAPFWPLLHRLWPTGVITSEELGRAMILIAAGRPSERLYENARLAALGRAGTRFRSAL